MPSVSARKILMILESCFPTQGGGGAEGQVRTLAGHLRDCGLHVTIIVPMVPRGPQVEHDQVDGIPVWRIPYPTIRKLGGFVILARLAWYLFRERRNYDILHAHIANNMAIVTSVIGRLLRKTVIVKLTGLQELSQGVLDRKHAGPAMFLKRVGLKSARYFQATSREIESRLLENGFPGEKIRVIPNAVNLHRFAAAGTIRREHESRRARTGVYVGRLEEVKGADILLAAWLQAFPRGSLMRLVLVGDGSLRETLQMRIDEAGRQEEIRLLGPKPDVVPCLAEADFGILPSRYEGLSNALLEYMAAGLPVLGTRVSGTEDFVEPGENGWLVDSDNVPQLAACLREIESMDAEHLRRFGANALQQVAAQARIDAVSAKLAELYRVDAASLRQLPHSEYG